MKQQNENIMHVSKKQFRIFLFFTNFKDDIRTTLFIGHASAILNIVFPVFYFEIFFKWSFISKVFSLQFQKPLEIVRRR